MRRAVPHGLLAQPERALARGASIVGSANWFGIGWLAAALGALAVVAACARDAPIDVAPRVFAAEEEPSSAERYCAWYGHARAGTLYFGQAAFWSGFRARGGDPLADMEIAGPQLVGRFDLGADALLPSLEVTAPGARSGVWDVHAHPNGRIYFTTYYEAMGWVEPRSGEVRHLRRLGTGLNEIAPGPDGELLISRYAGSRGGDGSVLRISPNGAALAELPLRPPAGFRVAPKTVAFDPTRREVWVTTDLLSLDGGAPRRDAYVLGLDGRERRRMETPELQFVVFDAAGLGARAEVEGRRLWLVRSEPGGPETRLLLDEDFEPGLDFVQDLALEEDGVVVATRWGGTVHVVDREGHARTLRLPRLEPGGLYYSAVVADGSVCATYCGGVRVVCQRLDAAPRVPTVAESPQPLR